MRVLEADIIPIKNNVMSLPQRMYFLLDVLQMIAIAFVSEIDYYHINGLDLFWDIQFNETTNS